MVSLRLPAVAACLTLAVAGCATTPNTNNPEPLPAGVTSVTTPAFPTDPPETATATPKSGGGETAAPASDVEQALKRAGLSQPKGATKSLMEKDADEDGFAELYRFSFVMPAADAKAYCSTGGLSGAKPATSLTDQERQLLGSSAQVAEGTTKCSGDSDGWERTVVIGGADPAVVWVAAGRRA